MLGISRTVLHGSGHVRDTTGEIDQRGVFVIPLLVWMVAALAVSVILRRSLGAIGYYRLLWHGRRSTARST